MVFLLTKWSLTANQTKTKHRFRTPYRKHIKVFIGMSAIIKNIVSKIYSLKKYKISTFFYDNESDKNVNYLGRTSEHKDNVYQIHYFQRIIFFFWLICFDWWRKYLYGPQ